MYLLGISALYHDSSACILKDGELIAAAQEERFTRIKHDSSFPINAIEFCLTEANVSIKDVEKVVFYEKPFLKFERILNTFFQTAPLSFSPFMTAFPLWIKEKLFFREFAFRLFRDHFNYKISKEKNFFLFTTHHRSHAASAYYPSPFNDALIITMDGVGEWQTTTIAIGQGNKIEIKEELNFPHSVGLLYSAFTYYLGFKVNSGEYKIMGLAPFGKPIYVNVIKEYLIDLKEDGSFRLRNEYFGFLTGLKMINSKFEKLFGQPTRKPETEINQFHADVAASIQNVTEEIIIQICKYARQKYNLENLCLAGGVALNCVANGKISLSNMFKQIWIQPAAGDSGGSIGAAYDVYHNYFNLRKEEFPTSHANDLMKSAFLGSSYSDNQLLACIHSHGLKYMKFDSDDILASKMANLIEEGNVIGVFRGKMEFGPRALGNRSILGNAFDLQSRSEINLKIKFRESFRPFAPIILKEDCESLFEGNCDSPYMLFTNYINKEFRNVDLEISVKNQNYESSILKAVSHIDFSSRIQTITHESNPFIYEVLKCIKSKRGYGVAINTSFNLRGEPIVESPIDAVNAFMRTNLDYLLLGSFLIDRKANEIRQVGKPTDLILD